MPCSLTLEDRQQIVQDFAESGRDATQKKYASHIKRFLVLLQHFFHKACLHVITDNVHLFTYLAQ